MKISHTFNVYDVILVDFYDRKQVEGNEQTKAITVEKINAEANENC